MSGTVPQFAAYKGPIFPAVIHPGVLYFIGPEENVELFLGLDGQRAEKVNRVREFGGYDFVQPTEASLWVINHNLGHRPLVAPMLEGVLQFEGEVTHPSINQTLIQFLRPVRGTARLV